jgi:hypothetical protein
MKEDFLFYEVAIRTGTSPFQWVTDGHMIIFNGMNSNGILCLGSVGSVAEKMESPQQITSLQHANVFQLCNSYVNVNEEHWFKIETSEREKGYPTHSLEFNLKDNAKVEEVVGILTKLSIKKAVSGAVKMGASGLKSRH